MNQSPHDNIAVPGASFAYTDDVSILASTAPGLQQLVNTCSVYNLIWRFKFGIKKAVVNILAYYVNMCDKEPTLYLGNNQIHNSDSIDILGVTITSKTNFNQRVDNRH